MTIPYVTLLLIIIWRVYWRISEITADREKEKTKKTIAFVDGFQRMVIVGLFLLACAQLLGVTIVPYGFSSQTIGFMVVCVGLLICILARRALGTNWANSYEFQIKKQHELVTRGIYRYIRHPIYSGIFCMLVGAELVVQSYLVLPYLVVLPLGMYWQAKREEEILTHHFGKTYVVYMKQTKMFVPFIW